MNSTTVGFFGIPAVLLGLMYATSLTLSWLAHVLFVHFCRPKQATRINTVGGLLSSVVALSLASYGPIVESRSFATLFAVCILCWGPVLYVYFKIDVNRKEQQAADRTVGY